MLRLIVSLIALLCARLLLAEPVAYAPVSVDMQLKRVSEHVYYVQGVAGVATDNEGFVSNACVIVTGAGVVVVDSLGSPSLAHRLLQLIRRITDEPVVRVITTHYHADHIYGLQVFEDLGAEILAPAGVENYLTAESARERLEERRFSLDPWVNDNTRLVWPDRYISKPEGFRLGDVEIQLTPIGGAHSDGDMTLYIKPDRVLLSGDVIFEGRVPYLGDANTATWLAVLASMEHAQLTALVPGHGGAAKDPNQAIAATRRYLAYLREHMGEAVAEFIPFAEVYDSVDWSPFQDLPAFEAANRRNAYQVYLSMEAEALGN